MCERKKGTQPLNAKMSLDILEKNAIWLEWEYRCHQDNLLNGRGRDPKIRDKKARLFFARQAAELLVRKSLPGEEKELSLEEIERLYGISVYRQGSLRWNCLSPGRLKEGELFYSKQGVEDLLTFEILLRGDYRCSFSDAVKLSNLEDKNFIYWSISIKEHQGVDRRLGRMIQIHTDTTHSPA